MFLKDSCSDQVVCEEMLMLWQMRHILLNRPILTQENKVPSEVDIILIYCNVTLNEDNTNDHFYAVYYSCLGISMMVCLSQ